MKKSLKITLVCALALFLLAGCAAAPASSAENLSTAYSSTGTVLTAASESLTESLPLKPTFCAFTVRSFAVITRSSLETTACL